MAIKGVVPSNTRRANQWALRNFTGWIDFRSIGEEPVPSSQGLGSSVNSAAAVSVEDEEQLLDKEVLSMDNSTNLHYMVFFYVGIHCLRGGQEQQSLQINQFTCHPANVNE